MPVTTVILPVAIVTAVTLILLQIQQAVRTVLAGGGILWWLEMLSLSETYVASNPTTAR